MRTTPVRNRKNGRCTLTFFLRGTVHVHIHQERVNTTVLCTWIKQHLELDTTSTQIHLRISSGTNVSLKHGYTVAYACILPTTHLVIPYSFAPGMSGYLGRPPTATTTRAAVMVSSFPRRFTCWQRREVNVKHIVEGVVKAHAVAMILSVDAFLSKSYWKLQARYYTVVIFLVVDATIHQPLCSKIWSRMGVGVFYTMKKAVFQAFPDHSPSASTIVSNISIA